MFGAGPAELLILLAILIVGIVGLAVLYLVVRAAVRAEKRDSSDH